MASSNTSIDEPPLPAFLQQTRGEIQSAFVDLEWQQRNRLAAGIQPSSPPSKWARLTEYSATSRNRYMNVEPFASNRIKLKVIEGGNDYINASPIVLGERRYIATQGPKDSSTAHFWRMIAAETSNKAIIVMLTQTHEAGREKCFPYFPSDSDAATLDIPIETDSGDDHFQGEVKLLSTEVDDQTSSTIRHFKLRTKETESDPYTEKDVWHLLFGGWPDFLVPEGEDRKALMQLIRLSRRLNEHSTAPVTLSFPDDDDDTKAIQSSDGSVREDSIAGQTATTASGLAGATKEYNPRVVHCSAGVGRSGTFIALDHLLTLLEAGRLDEVPAGTDPVAETVDRLRQQRMMMVQGEAQFAFLYEVLREAWIERWRVKGREV